MIWKFMFIGGVALVCVSFVSGTIASLTAYAPGVQVSNVFLIVGGVFFALSFGASKHA